MSRLLLFLSLGCSRSDDLTIVEAPRPNSGTHTPSEARRALLVQLTSIPRVPATEPVVAGWRNPTPGFHVHVDAHGALTIDGAPADLAALQQARDRTTMMLDSTTASVLFTFEEDPMLSTVIPKVLDTLFDPAVQIYLLQ